MSASPRSCSVSRIAPSHPVPQPSGSPSLNAERDRRVEQLFQLHAAAVLRHARRADPGLAEDVLSETFAVALRRHADIPAGAELPWLYVVADNVLRNQQRSRRRATALATSLAAHAPDADRPAEPPVIGPALGTLPDRERALLTMTGFEGLSASEAADRLGIPAGTARNAMVRGRRQLASTLAALGVVVASVVFAFLFVRGGDDSKRAGRVVAESIRDATTIYNVARVQSGASAGSSAANGAAAATQYRISTDTDAERERVSLPGGLVAGSDRGEPLHVVGGAGASKATVRAAQRRHGADLAALDVGSPTEIERFLVSQVARRTTTDGPSIAGRATALVRGGIVDRAGKSRDLELFITTKRPQVVRLRTRLVGARAWATIDFVEWKIVPRPDASGSKPNAQVPAPAATSPRSITASAPRPKSQAPARGAAGNGSQAGSDLTRSGRSATAKAAEQAEHSARGAGGTPRFELPAPYPGTTGRVLHTQTVEADGTIAEHWREIGGGERWLTTSVESRMTNQDGSAVRLGMWSSPDVDVVVNPFGSTAYLACGPGERAGFVTPPVDDPALIEPFASIAAQLADGAALPDGPVLDGRDTAAVDLPRRAATADHLRLIVDRASGAPRQVLTVPDAGPPRTVTYALWEVLPPGAAGEQLAQPAPEHVKVLSFCANP